MPTTTSQDVPGEYDPWPLEDERTSREVTSFQTFRYYALSPATSEVTYHLNQHAPPEMEAHGPGRRRVWIALPTTLDPVFWVGLNRLAHQLARKGIFRPG